LAEHLQQLENALDVAVGNTFESMLFLESSPIARPQFDAEEICVVELEATAPLKCLIAVEAPQTTVDALRDALYSDGPAGQNANVDVLAEILNVVAGLFLTEVDDSTPIALGLPRERTGGALSSGDPSRSVERAYQLESGAMVMRVSLN
jgi:hypothetical protein